MNAPDVVIASLMNAEHQLRLAMRISALKLRIEDEAERDRHFAQAVKSLQALQNMHHEPIEDEANEH